RTLSRLGRQLRRRSAPICGSVSEWVRQRQPSLECEVLLHADQVQRALPRTIEPEMLDDYVLRQTTSFRERYIARIPGASVLGQNGLVILPDGAYAAESVYSRTLLLKDLDYKAPRRRPVVEKRGNYFSLLNIWAKDANYYHWLHDSLQRLYKVG